MAASNDVVAPLIVIVGPTASGKTGLAVDLAKRFKGEVISADSRAIYVGMDVGTAKPSMSEREGVPHWGFDLVEPGQPFSVADFKSYALQKIAEIRARGHVPFLVGGTGLYIDAIIFDYQFGPPADLNRRNELMATSIEQLHEYCFKNNVMLPENSQNKRYVVRAIEQNSINQQRRAEPISTSVIVGIATDRDVLRARISGRAEQLFKDGVVGEATMLGEKYSWGSEAMTGNIYPLIRQYLQKELTLDEVAAKFTTLDWRLAKRQLTWLRRNPFIVWRSLPEAKVYLEQVLANE